MLSASQNYPLLILLLVALLLVATWTDLRHHRIPNLVSLGGIVLGLTLQTWLLGLDGLLTGLGGLAVGLGIFLPFHVFKGMGAGDVKLMGTAGAFLGPVGTLLACGLSLGAGSVWGIWVLVSRKGLISALRRYLTTARFFAASGNLRLSYIPPQPGEAAATRFPYALAITTGTLLALWWLQRLDPVFQSTQHLLTIT